MKEIVESISAQVAEKMNQWFLEIMKKHNLIKDDCNVTNFDIYWLNELGVKINNTDDNKIQVRLNGVVIGEWDNNYKYIQTDDLTFKVNINCWN